MGGSHGGFLTTHVSTCTAHHLKHTHVHTRVDLRFIFLEDFYKAAVTRNVTDISGVWIKYYFLLIIIYLNFLVLLSLCNVQRD